MQYDSELERRRARLIYKNQTEKVVQAQQALGCFMLSVSAFTCFCFCFGAGLILYGYGIDGASSVGLTIAAYPLVTLASAIGATQIVKLTYREVFKLPDPPDELENVEPLH